MVELKNGMDFKSSAEINDDLNIFVKIYKEFSVNKVCEAKYEITLIREVISDKLR